MDLEKRKEIAKIWHMANFTVGLELIADLEAAESKIVDMEFRLTTHKQVTQQHKETASAAEQKAEMIQGFHDALEADLRIAVEALRFYADGDGNDPRAKAALEKIESASPIDD